MSDYYGNATLEDWVAEEVMNVDVAPKEIVALFEKWREPVENSIEAWMDSDRGDGPRSWRDWGRGYAGIPESDADELDAAFKKVLDHKSCNVTV